VIATYAGASVVSFVRLLVMAAFTAAFGGSFTDNQDGAGFLGFASMIRDDLGDAHCADRAFT